MPTPSIPLLTLALFLLFAACEDVQPRKPNAVGSAGEVVVVTDSATWSGPVGDAIRAVLGSSVGPPLGGLDDFRLTRQNLTNENFRLQRSSRNVMFVAALDDSSAVERFLTARLDPGGLAMIREGRGTSVVPREDLWATGQIVVMATAANDSLLAEAIRSRADTLRAVYTEQALERTAVEMFDRARQFRLEEQLLEKHGFTVNVQHDYFLSQDTSVAIGSRQGRFVRLRRVLSDTWRDFFVYYEDAPQAVVDAQRVEVITDLVLETFIRGQYDSSFVAIDRLRPVRTDTVTIGGRSTRQTRGLWRMTEDFMGGPFVRYSFYEPEQQRLYIFFGMIYAPQHRFRAQKREFLRQLEVVARTFRTAEDAGAEA